MAGPGLTCGSMRGSPAWARSDWNSLLCTRLSSLSRWWLNAIKDCSRRDGFVLDPFLGSGTTAVAAKALAEDWSFLDSVLAGVYTVPGDGSIDFVGVFKAVPNYSGWIVIEAEQDPEKANPKKYVTMGYKNLKRFLKEAGLN